MKASDNVFPKLLFSEGAAHGTPASGEIAVYAKTDKKLYAKDDTGSEVELGAGIPDAPSDGNLYGRKDGDWEQVTGGGSADSYTIITEGSAFTASPGTHAGRSRYIRAGGDITFDNSEGYAAGQSFNIRATAAIELIEDGVTLDPTYGGTLDLEAGMAVTVIMTSATTADVIGLTVASP